MVDVVDGEAFELARGPDDGAVEEFAAHGSDPAFRERVRDWGTDGGLEVLGSTRADCETGEHGDETIENARHSSQDAGAFTLVNPQDRVSDASLCQGEVFGCLGARLNEPSGVGGRGVLALVVGSGK